MNKDQFLKQLDSLLKRLSLDERRDILQDYEEYFAIGIEQGKSEEEIAASLGAPHQIAKELLASYHLEKAEKSMTTGNILRAIWAVIGLGFFNLVIVSGPFFALVGLIMAGWAVGIAFAFSPLQVLFHTVINPESFVLFDIFLSVAQCGLGLFIGIGMFFVTKKAFNLFVRYLKFNVSLVKGGSTHD